MLRVVMEGFVQMIDVDEEDREFNKNLKKIVCGGGLSGIIKQNNIDCARCSLHVKVSAYVLRWPPPQHPVSEK